VALATRFQAEVEVTRSDDPAEWVNGRSVLSLLSLAASFGTRLRVRTTGAEAEKALAALGQVLEAPLEGDGG
jgi:phosphotransferase system HPr (HPr) family protein